MVMENVMSHLPIARYYTNHTFAVSVGLPRTLCIICLFRA